jgi:shikimate dehydrogenase
MDNFQLFAVAGHPVFHSKSPALFNRAFAADSFPGAYVRLAARSPEEAMAFFRELHLRGMNVTAPFKTRILELVDELDPAAARIGAVNAVVAEGGRAAGHNTDHQGVVGALNRHGIAVPGKLFIVLGAGGAGRAAAYGLTQAGAEVVVVNRTPENADRAAADFDCRAGRIEDLETLLSSAHGLVSTISSPETPVEEGWLREDLVVLDAFYPDSPLARAAEKRGCRVVGGEDWLLHQALPAYRLFTGLAPREDVMAEALSAGWGPRRKRVNVSLIGFMGTGKSDVAARLAPLAGFRLADIDSAVEKREGASVADIFRTKGEAHFREAEKFQLRNLGLQDGWVVACGGGAVLDPENRRFLAENSTVVWLHCPLGSCLKRIAPGTRPLLDGDDSEQAARRLLETRLPYYALTSDIVVRSEEAAEKVAAIIHEEIGPSLEH